MCRAIFNLKAEALFLDCLCCVGGMIKFAACVANLNYSDGLDGFFIVLLIARVLVGILEFGIGLFGMYGMLAENTYYLWMFSFLEITCTSVGALLLTLHFCHEKAINSQIKAIMYETVPLSDIERQYHCCGRSGIEEYQNQTDTEVPPSCTSRDIFARRDVLAHEGCDLKLGEYFHQKRWRTVFVYWVFVFVQLMCAFVSMRYACRLGQIKKAARTSAGTSTPRGTV